MILESAQMHSTALPLNSVIKGYKPTPINRPCTNWKRASPFSWKWLRNLSSYLNSEYKFRFKKQTNHVSWYLINLFPYPPIKGKGLAKFAQGMPNIYKREDTVTADRVF